MHTTVYVHNGFLLLAFFFFLFAGVRVKSERVDWTALGFCAVTAAFLFPFFV